MSACLLSAATVGVVVAAGLQSADVATTGEKLRSVATFVLFLLIVAAVLLVLQMKNQTENCLRAVSSVEIAKKKIDFKGQEAREQIMRTE